jgi:phosphatidylglycerophosphatase A
MPADTTTSAAPDARFLFSHPAHFIALGFGAGLIRFAPGTWGTLVGWGLAELLLLLLGNPFVLLILVIPLVLLAVWASDVTARNLGMPDHGSIVIDEVVAFMPLAIFAFKSIWLQLFVFVVFRIFDIWKPFPIRYFEAKIPGGLGVVVDDLIAAFYTFVVFALFIVVMHKGFGFQ